MHVSQPENQADRGDGYDPKYAHIAKVICACGGTTADLATAFGLPWTTIEKWQSRHSDFAKACDLGNELAITQLRGALFKLATGHEYTAQKVIRGKSPMIIEQRLRVEPRLEAIKYCLETREEFRKYTYEEVEKKVLKKMAQEIRGTILRPVELPPKNPETSDK